MVFIVVRHEGDKRYSEVYPCNDDPDSREKFLRWYSSIPQYSLALKHDIHFVTAENLAAHILAGYNG